MRRRNPCAYDLGAEDEERFSTRRLCHLERPGAAEGLNCDELLKHDAGNSSLLEFPFRPGRSVQSKKRLTGSGTDLNTVLRCFLLFKTVVTSRNILVFKTYFPRPKNGFPSQGRRNGSRRICWPKDDDSGSEGSFTGSIAAKDPAASSLSNGPASKGPP